MSPIPDTSLTGDENVRQQIAGIASATGSTIQDVERGVAAFVEALAGEQTVVTPAVERATRAAAHRAGIGFAALDAGTQDLHRDVTRTGLAAGLDVEEMACELFVADSGQDRAFALGIWRAAPDDQAVKKHWRRIATALRSAILGGAS